MNVSFHFSGIIIHERDFWVSEQVYIERQLLFRFSYLNVHSYPIPLANTSKTMLNHTEDSGRLCLSGNTSSVSPLSSTLTLGFEVYIIFSC